MNRYILLIYMLSSLLFASQYNVGDTISNQDVNQEFDVCFGQYQTSTFKLQDFQGKVIWLQFSASWWEPCLGFIPSGEEIEEYWKDNEDVAIIDFLDDIGQPFSCNTWGSFGDVEHPVIIDDLSYDFHDKFHGDYAYPTNVFIDHNMIVYRFEAAMTITQINQTIQEMLDQIDNLELSDQTFPDSFVITKLYPNPFNPVLNINFEVFKPSFVDIKIKNISGREMQNIYSGYLYAGKHEKVWYASDFPSGLYLISLVLDKQIINTSKVSLIK